MISKKNSRIRFFVFLVAAVNGIILYSVFSGSKIATRYYEKFFGSKPVEEVKAEHEGYFGKLAQVRDIISKYPKAREILFKVKKRKDAEDAGLLNVKKFSTGSYKSKYVFFPGHINYVDPKTGRVLEIDATFEKEKDGTFTITRANYSARAPQYSDEAMEFSYEGSTLTFAPTRLGNIPVRRVAGVLEGNKIIYADAFGPGIDYVLEAEPDELKKLVVFRSAPKDLSQDIRIEFKTNITGKGKINGRNTRIEKFFFRQPAVWDLSGRRVPIAIEFENNIFTKILPAEFFKSPERGKKVVYPVTTDVTTSYYSGAGDGYVFYSADSASWDTAHDDVGGVSVTANYLNLNAEVGSQEEGGVKIQRAFIPIDTSGIANNDEITGATLNIYVQATSNTDNDGDDWINVVQTTQASTSSLSATDYDQCGSVNNPTEGATRIDITSISTAAYSTFTLNATGQGWISKTSTSQFGLREGHDAIDSPITSGTINKVTFGTSEITGTGNDPYVSVDTTSAVISSVSTQRTIFATSTANIIVSSSITGETAASTTLEYLFFMDQDGDAAPDTNETYITGDCASSALWSSGVYTFVKSGFTISDGQSPKTHSWECSNSSFTQNGLYTIYLTWKDTSGTIDTDSATSFQSCDQPTGTNNWNDTNYENRVLLNFRSATFSAALLDFPVLVKATSTNFGFDDPDSSANDVKFVDGLDDGETTLSYEREFYDSTTTLEGYWWVKVPRIATSTDCDYIQMYYDYAGAGDSSSSTAPWRQDYYEAVWHFGQTGTSTTYNFQDGVAPTAGYAGTEDLNLESGNPSTNQNGDTVNTIDVLSCSQGSGICRNLMQWDISTITSCTVTSASLTIQVSNGTADRYGVYAVRRNWGETTATYNTYDGTNNWTTAGVGDTSNDRYGTDLMNGNSDSGFGRNTSGSLTFDFDSDGTALIEDWIDGTITNNGIVSMDHDSTDDDGFAWDYRGDVTTTDRPKLTVVCGSSDTYLDSTLNNHDETNSDLASRKEKSQGKFGYSPKFDGSSSVIGITDSAGFDLKNYTITGWFRRDGTGDSATFSAGQTLEPFVAKGYDEGSDSESTDIQFSAGFHTGGQSTLAANWEDYSTVYSFQQGVLPDSNYAGVDNLIISSASASTNLKNRFGLQVDYTGGTANYCASGICRVLMQWDISTISSCNVSSASVAINVSNATADRFSVYAVRRNWAQDTTTWNTYDGTNNWTTAGASSTASDTYGTDLMDGNSDGGWGSASLGAVTHNFDSDGLSAIEDWINGVVTNNGILIRDTINAGPVDDDGYTWASSTDSTSGNRPKLTINCAGDNAHVGGTTLSNSSWYYFSYRVASGTMANLYLNGFANNTTTYSLTYSPSTGGSQKVGIGTAYNSSGTADGKWNGYLDEIRIFKTVVSTSTGSNDSVWLRAEWFTADNGYVQWGTEATNTTGALSVSASSTQEISGVTYSFYRQSSTTSNVESVKVVGGSGTWTLNLSCQDNAIDCMWKGQTEADRFSLYQGMIPTGTNPSSTGLFCHDGDPDLSCDKEGGGACSGVSLVQTYDCFLATKADITIATGASASGTYWLKESEWEIGVPAFTSASIYTTTLTYDLQ